jgi:hypothetical protein
MNFSPSMSVCATCALWGGPRQPGPANRSVSVGNATDKGQCLGGGLNGANVPASGSCPQWQKWPALS